MKKVQKIQLNPVRVRDEMVVAAVKGGITKSDVARYLGIDRRTVYHIIDRVGLDSPLISKFRDLRGEISTYNQARRQEKQDLVLDNITEDEVKKADLKSKAVVLDILGKDKEREYNQERLEGGKSTENVAVIVKAIQELKAKQKK